MSVAPRPSALGATRTCPHCKATVLESARVCPGCQHHLRFNPADADEPVAAYSVLRVDAKLQHPVTTEACEYCVVLAINDERAEKVTRQVVGVGVLQANEWRTFSVSVELRPVRALPTPKRT